MQSSLENTQAAFLPPPLQPQCGHVTRAPPIKRAPSNWGSVMQKQGLGRRWSPQHVQGRSPAWSPVQRPVPCWQVVPQLFQHTASGFHGRGTSSLAHFHSCSSATLRIPETSPPANTALSTLVRWSRLCLARGAHQPDADVKNWRHVSFHTTQPHSASRPGHVVCWQVRAPALTACRGPHTALGPGAQETLEGGSLGTHQWGLCCLLP